MNVTKPRGYLRLAGEPLDRGVILATIEHLEHDT